MPTCRNCPMSEGHPYPVHVVLGQGFCPKYRSFLSLKYLIFPSRAAPQGGDLNLIPRRRGQTRIFCPRNQFEGQPKVENFGP